MSILARFMSHGYAEEREFESKDAAFRWLAQEDELGELAPVAVIFEGETIEGRELENILWDIPVYSRWFLADDH